MSLSLFDVIGPIMHGPSSNHTGGANRIGYLAYRLIGETPKALTFGFHPVFMRMFTGHRTHAAMLAGCLGYREYEDRSRFSLEHAYEQGISLTYVPLNEKPEVDRNTMRVITDCGGISWSVNGISVGGGTIVISSINGVPVDIDGNSHILCLILKPGTDTAPLNALIREICDPRRLESGEGEGSAVICVQTADAIPEEAVARVREAAGDTLLAMRVIEPLLPFADRDGGKPLFSTMEELLVCCKDRDLPDAAIAYECKRTGKTADEVMAEALKIAEVIDISMQRGLQGNNPLYGGFCTGSDGKTAFDYANSGKTIVGPVFSRAIGRALAVSETNGSGGRIAAAPTAGSAGALPGTLFTVAETLGKSREDLARALIVAAALGAIIGNTCSFSGSIGGCQAEMGIGAGMAAGASVWMAGGTPEASVHACALAIKSLLGLVCDPLAGPVEIPCIKRNAVGVSTALMGAEMALAGIRSAVPPDQVIDALADVQRRLPTSLRGACTGGLASCAIAKDYQKIWADKLAAGAAGAAGRAL